MSTWIRIVQFSVVTVFCENSSGGLTHSTAKNVTPQMLALSRS
jgi:hypothetical protein